MYFRPGEVESLVPAISPGPGDSSFSHFGPSLSLSMRVYPSSHNVHVSGSPEHSLQLSVKLGQSVLETQFIVVHNS